jgi:hypothetical protein
MNWREYFRGVFQDFGLERPFYVDLAMRLREYLWDAEASDLLAGLNEVGLSVPGVLHDSFQKALWSVNVDLKPYTLYTDKSRGRYREFPLVLQGEVALLLVLEYLDWPDILLPEKRDDVTDIGYIVQYFLALSSVDHSEKIGFLRGLVEARKVKAEVVADRVREEEVQRQLAEAKAWLAEPDEPEEE